MEKSQTDNRFLQTPNSTFSTKKGRSGYEPSDTETEWHEIPRHERERKNMTLGPEETKALPLTNKGPMALHRRHPSRFEYEVPSTPSTGSVPGQPRRRHLSKSPYRPRIVDNGDDDDGASLSYITGLNSRRNISPLPRPDLGVGRTVSPYRKAGSGLLEVDRVSEKPLYRRAVTAPRLRHGKALQNGVRATTKDMALLKQREASPFKAPSVGEINEMIAQVKLSKNPTSDYSSVLESTDSIQPGDLFFSRECNALQGKSSSLPKSLHQQYGYFTPRPAVTTVNPIRTPSESGNLDMNIQGTSSINNVLSRSTTGTTSRRGSGTGKPSASSSLTSDASGKTSDSIRKFTSNRKKSQKDAWFNCMMRPGSCRTSRKSPERRPLNEASFIERAMVVESIPQFWADKHQPASLNGFICNKQEALLLKGLVCLLFPNTQIQFSTLSLVCSLPTVLKSFL